MPTYVYRFIDTGETIEVRQAFEDDALTEAPHPSDGKPRLVKKVFMPVGITFKGSGFYKTDASSSAKTSTSASPSADTPAGTPTSTSSSTSSSAASTAPSSTSSDTSSNTGSSATKPAAPATSAPSTSSDK